MFDKGKILFAWCFAYEKQRGHFGMTRESVTEKWVDMRGVMKYLIDLFWMLKPGWPGL